MRAPSAKTRATLRLVACVVALLGSTGTAAAQGNYRSTPIGGRTTLVGGTGVVYGSDGAAAFLNPATVVRVDPGRLTFSVNFYSIGVLQAPRWYAPGDIDRSRFGDVPREGASMTNASFDALPSSLCIFLRAGDISWFTMEAQAELRESGARIGICFATVQSSEFAFAAENFARAGQGFATRQGQTVTERYTRFEAGPTYAMNVNDRLAIGASLHASLASYRSLFASTSTTYGPGPAPISSSFYGASRGTSFQATATLGATYRFGNQTVGLALESPSLHVYGTGGANRATHFEGPADASTMLIADDTFRSASPPRIAFGTGVEERWGSAELDVGVWLPMQQAFYSRLEGTVVSVNGTTVTDTPVSITRSARTRGVVNVAAGGEVYLNPRVSLLGGLGTDLSAVPKGGLTMDEMQYLPDRRNRFYASFGVGSHGPGGDLLVGTELSFMAGERLAVTAYQLPPTLAQTSYGAFSAVFVVAGSTSLNAIKRAVKDVKDVLDPKNKKKD